MGDPGELIISATTSVNLCRSEEIAGTKMASEKRQERSEYSTHLPDSNKAKLQLM
jgi:hypothetical protein